MKIEWTPPEPRTGKFGALDKFIGPGATKAETYIQFIAAGVAAFAIPIIAAARGLEWNVLQYIVGFLLAGDIVGGVTTNATNSAKRWYHREGRGFWNHFGFILLHGLHLLIVAWAFREMDWTWIAFFYAYLIAGAIIILLTPLYLQRPVAMLLFVGAVISSYAGFSPMPGMQWFIPLFFIKLFVSHLLKEAPFAPATSG